MTFLMILCAGTNLKQLDVSGLIYQIPRITQKLVRQDIGNFTIMFGPQKFLERTKQDEETIRYIQLSAPQYIIFHNKTN